MFFPSLGAEIVSVGPKDVLPPGIDVLGEDDDFTFADEDGRGTIGSAAPG